MIHNRKWAILPIATVDELIDVLRQSQCLCQGFRFDRYLFVNDAFSEDGAQEYGVIEVAPDVVATPGALLAGTMIDSWTCSWMTPDGMRRCLQQLGEPHVINKAVTFTVHSASSCGFCE